MTHPSHLPTPDEQPRRCATFLPSLLLVGPLIGAIIRSALVLVLGRDTYPRGGAAQVVHEPCHTTDVALPLLLL
jgi:hypothetical protein